MGHLTNLLQHALWQRKINMQPLRPSCQWRATNLQHIRPKPLAGAFKRYEENLHNVPLFMAHYKQIANRQQNPLQVEPGIGNANTGKLIKLDKAFGNHIINFFF